MSSSEVHELAVQLTPEGAGETQRALDNTSEKFDETADRTEDASQDLNRFSRKFTGALAVASGILGGIAGKFLSMVPAVQDAFISIGSVIDGLIMQFEDEFGPAIRDVADEFFELGQEVRQADSFLEALGIAATGTAEIITDIRNSLLRTAGRYSVQLVVDIATRLQDPEQRQRIIENAEERVAEGFTPEALARNTLASIPFAAPAGQFGGPFVEGARREIETQFETETGRQFPGVFGGFGPRSIEDLPLAEPVVGSAADFGVTATSEPGRSTTPTTGPSNRVETETGDEQVTILEQIRRLLQDEQRRTTGRDETLEATLRLDSTQESGVKNSLTAGGY